MEAKKSPKADLENKKSVFMLLGVALSLGICIFAFGYSQREKKIAKIDMGLAMVEEDIIEITIQEEKPTEPAKQQISYATEILNIVKNDTKIVEEIKFDDFKEDAVVVKDAKVVESVQVSDEPFKVVEHMPKFQGKDINAFHAWVMSRIQYPRIAADNNISGRVMVSFVIERDGALTNIIVEQSPDQSLSDETIRVLKSSPKWEPGKQRTTPVRVKFYLPVQFTLQ